MNNDTVAFNIKVKTPNFNKNCHRKWFPLFWRIQFIDRYGISG